MSRLYLYFFFALLASLIVFAAAMALLWHPVNEFISQGNQVLGHPVLAVHALASVLIVLALTVGICALPLVRRLTGRLERLQAGVESLGAGDLGARVAVEGRDEVAQLATGFNRAASRIEALVKANKTLLANVSHELRTPLARIRMTVELMKESADPKRRADLNQDIAELDALIDELLLSSRLEAVARPEVAEDIDLHALVAEECAHYESIKLEGADMHVRGDGRLLRRMLRNLLENACRHGAPPIEVSLAAQQQLATILVVDYGPIITADQRERLFEPFYRGKGLRDVRGVGLGLSLVRQIARQHGGDAHCVETEARRNGFSVTLPTISCD